MLIDEFLNMSMCLRIRTELTGGISNANPFEIHANNSVTFCQE